MYVCICYSTQQLELASRAARRHITEGVSQPTEATTVRSSSYIVSPAISVVGRRSVDQSVALRNQDGPDQPVGIVAGPSLAPPPPRSLAAVAAGRRPRLEVSAHAAHRQGDKDARGVRISIPVQVDLFTEFV